ncbi:hypothetical protein [Frateuria sp. Soil773]|uniref:hypothetical protein n=1 Tax=Frateuria sp. Soil773 TaxID=1736407 RepID=UPI000A5CE5B1|nr:hypothetical protein [Frateuria sp. Soil773]
MNVLPTQMLSVANFAATPAANTAPAHLDDVAKFKQSFADAAPKPAATEAVTPVSHELSPSLKAVLGQFDSLNGQASRLGKLSEAMKANSRDLSPGQIIDMTLKCHELVFQAELTSNVANRSSEGVQQLFRQQS